MQARPKVRTLVQDTTKAFKRRRYTLVYTYVRVHFTYLPKIV